MCEAGSSTSTIEKAAGPRQGRSTVAHTRKAVELSLGLSGQVLPSARWDLQDGGDRGWTTERTWVIGDKWVHPFPSLGLSGYSRGVDLGIHPLHSSDS